MSNQMREDNILQTITINLPDKIYRQIEQQAQQSNRAVEDEISAVVEATFLSSNQWAGLPQELVEQVEQLQFLDDKHLLQAAQMRVSENENEQMAELLAKKADKGLTEAEQAEVKRLQRVANQVMLIRAEAAVLLQKRGIDISTFSP